MSEEPRWRLIRAVRDGDLAGVRAAVEAGADVNMDTNTPGEHMFSALGDAAGSNHSNAFAIVRYLVENGADIDTGGDGWALRKAAANIGPDALAIVKYLVECLPGQSFRTYRFNESSGRALGNAAANIWNAPAIVEYLVEHGRKRPDGSWERANIDTNDGAALRNAVRNPGSDALAIVAYLIENGANININCHVMHNAVNNETRHALAIVKYLVEHGANVNLRDSLDFTALTTALFNTPLFSEKNDIADFLVYHDGFLPSQLMPRPKGLDEDIYKIYRKKSIVHVNGLIERRGPLYARAIAADIEKIVKDDASRTTREDIEALEPLVKKIASKDWVNDVQISSDDFMDCNITR